MNLRGNKPLLLDKVIYTEHILAKNLKDCSISEYNSKWTKNTQEIIHTKEKTTEEKKSETKKKIGWDNF